jgi:two-component system, OmpR family, sensor histidine kinase KdpD
VVEHDERPDPDALLARVHAEEARQQRGRLKVFFGAAAGVGKTYAMLEAAHEQQAAGVSVLVGWVDTHGRQETQALLEGLEVLPRRQVSYRGTTVPEFDLDATLQRRPQLVLVDELAHTNAPDARHPKRWQDVEELLQAGIDVYTTVNVQHLESLNDVVAQITDVVVRETVPDSFLEKADELELIDLPPDELLQRLREGKVYIPQQTDAALRNFFRKGNLIALRELALRRTADRVDAQMQEYMRAHAIAHTWPAAERILVCISPSPLAERLVRAARRMAVGLRAEWIAAYVETPAAIRLNDTANERVMRTLRLAEQLGAETVTLSGQSVSEAVLTYAHTRNVTKVIAGKPTHPRWRDVVFGSVLDDLVRNSGEIDVYVISGEEAEGSTSPAVTLQRTSPWSAYAKAVGVVGLCSVAARLVFPSLAEANLIMIYLIGIVFIAMRYGRGPSILASVLSVVAFDVFFVVPYLSLAVADTEYLITFVVMLAVALVISTLTVRMQRQAQAAREREQHTAALYAMSRDLARTRGVADLLAAAAQHVAGGFGSQVAILMPDSSGQLAIQASVSQNFELSPDERGVAQWAYEHGQSAGAGTDTLPGADGIYTPLVAARGVLGVLGVQPSSPRQLAAPEQLHLLETFASQTALAVERAQLAEEAERTRLQIETERLRSSLLSSVSHDLRTPLAAIVGATSTLADDDEQLDPVTRSELAQTAYEEATRLNRLVGNLLDMTRLESGTVEVRKDWQSLEEVIGAALARVDVLLGERRVTTRLDPDLPLIPLDGVLIEQVFVNLLENAAKYTPPDSPIELAAWPDEASVIVEVADRGQGIAAEDETRVFDKFYRGKTGRTRVGVGLGLAICQAIVAAHGGRIWVESRAGGGASFRFTLPIAGQPPLVQEERPEAAQDA